MNRRVARAGPWYPITVDDDLAVAQTIAALVAETLDVHDVRVVSDNALAREIGSVDSERILDLLRNPTIAESQRAAELAVVARERLGLPATSV